MKSTKEEKKKCLVDNLPCLVLDNDSRLIMTNIALLLDKYFKISLRINCLIHKVRSRVLVVLACFLISFEDDEEEEAKERDKLLSTDPPSKAPI